MIQVKLCSEKTRKDLPFLQQRGELFRASRQGRGHHTLFGDPTPETPTAWTCRSASTIKLSILLCELRFRGMPG
jgi:hypothetical protein